VIIEKEKIDCWKEGRRGIAIKYIEEMKMIKKDIRKKKIESEKVRLKRSRDCGGCWLVGFS
jgi:hypothetical protein